MSVVAPAVGLYSSNLLYSHKNNFPEAAMKRPASKLHKAVQKLTKKERKESGLYLAGRYTELNLTVDGSNHLRVIGKDINGFDIWAAESDKFDTYLQRDRQLLTCHSQAFREGIYFAAYWEDGMLTGDQLGGLLCLIDDVAKGEGAKAQQGSPGLGQAMWQPKNTANQSEAGTSSLYDPEVF